VADVKNALKTSLNLAFEKTCFVNNRRTFVAGVLISAAAAAAAFSLSSAISSSSAAPGSRSGRGGGGGSGGRTSGLRFSGFSAQIPAG
jgi:Spy/CpxP family protein refolding chaperone